MQAFVTDWPGDKQHAKANARILAPYCSSVTILDDSNDYFGAQWEKARSLLTDDIMIFSAGDCWPPIIDIDIMFSKIKALLSDNTKIGVYSPLIRWSNWQFPKTEEIALQTYEVPMIEMLFFAVRKDIVKATPEHYDWCGLGVAYSLMATAKKLGYRIVCDYEYTAAHPADETGYSKQKAHDGFLDWKNSLDKADQDGIQSVIDESLATVLTGEQNMKPFKITKEEIELWRR